ncbi:hypothetical protein [Clostridium sp. Cult2]|uniref:hypothetical protein n=1 Tax=Clostridium sp. Cult2 TaxID=2079003 RepID=UPI001F3EEFB8|nr:hypothetical protein [Clostridium sp. Cult2]MCF6466779.1 hypothetical protein [Clostridium sp. Cult2]
MDFNDYLLTIEKRLEKNFDTIRNYTINDYNINLFAKYNIRTERYILTKKTVIDAMENNEYCFIKFFENFDKYHLRTYTDFLIGIIDILVNPNKEHMSSTITGVIVLENKPSSDIVNAIKNFKYHKGFAFGFKGWADIRLILVTINDKYIVTNKKGKEVSKVYSI